MSVLKTNESTSFQPTNNVFEFAFKINVESKLHTTTRKTPRDNSSEKKNPYIWVKKKCRLYSLAEMKCFRVTISIWASELWYKSETARYCTSFTTVHVCGIYCKSSLISRLWGFQYLISARQFYERRKPLWFIFETNVGISVPYWFMQFREALFYEQFIVIINLIINW